MTTKKIKHLLECGATLALMLFYCGTVIGQDQIIMRNNNVIKAKVQEVALNVIKYKRSDDPDGPVYDVRKTDVNMIIYENGTQDVFNPPADNNAGGDNTPAPADAAVTTAPPAMPEYTQPPCPVEGYLWNPGYWAWGAAGYYWVPGVWVAPPRVGLLWTPGYWGWYEGRYIWHGGYWGEHVGFYGGVCYGYGYDGRGWYGGRWEGGVYRYNTSVCHVNTTVIHNTYIDNTVVRNTTVVNHTSYNGGTGGITAQPTAEQQQYAKEQHVQPTPVQQQHITAAKNDNNAYAKVNNGKPAAAALDKPGGQRFNSEGHVTTVRPVPVTNQPNVKTGVKEQPVGNNGQNLHAGSQGSGSNQRTTESQGQNAHAGSQSAGSNTRSTETQGQNAHAGSQSAGSNPRTGQGANNGNHGTSGPARTVQQNKPQPTSQQHSAVTPQNHHQTVAPKPAPKPQPKPQEKPAPKTEERK